MHSHSHHGHHHHGTGKVLIVSTLATIAFVSLELWAGFRSHSLALLSDAGHNFTDAFALLLALAGVWLQLKPADEVKTYGYQRGGVLAAFVNALTLVILSFVLLYESYTRILHPEPVAEWTMAGVAGAGIVLNLGILLMLRGNSGPAHDLNIRAAAVHMLGDALSSAAIVVGAIAIHFTGWLLLDPLLSIGIALMVIWTSVDITREALNILLEGLPRGLTLDQVVIEMRQVTGVLDVHDVHIWSLGSSSHALSCHALIEDVPPSESECILLSLKKKLADRFRIHHTTIQFEHMNCGLSDTGCMTASTARVHTHHHGPGHSH